MAWLTVEEETVTARRPKRFKVHWRSTEPAARIPQRFLPGTQVVVSGDQPFASQTPLTPFFAFLSGVSQRLPPRTRAVATSGDQQFVDQTLLTPLLAFSSGLRMLVLGLILVALLPNLVLGGLFWLGVLNTPWSRPAMLAPNESPMPATRFALPPPVLSLPALLQATAGEEVTLPITLDGTDGVPARSIIAISGLPQGSTLSTGRPYGESEWNLKTDEIGDLQLVLPYTASGVAKLIFQLVAPDGAIIADAATVINMRPNPRANASASNINPEFTQVEVRAQGPEATGVAESPANLAAALAGDPVPLPSRRPTPTTNHADSTKWIKPSTFVNLREGPSPSSRVISVVPKGAKLHVMGRKKRWVQVTNPATSEKGWIYSPDVATVP
jgi:hypothetical protein